MGPECTMLTCIAGMLHEKKIAGSHFSTVDNKLNKYMKIRT